MNILKNLLIRELEKTLEDIKTDNCLLSEEEQSELLDLVIHRAIGAEEVCKILNISRATLTNYIRDGKVPRGRKLKFRKEKVWFKDEIMKICNH